MIELEASGVTDRKELIERTVQETGTTKRYAAELHLQLFGGVSGDKSPQSTKRPRSFISQKIGAHKGGIPLEQAKLKYDTPFRLKKALEKRVASMEAGMIYEEKEMKVDCKVGKNDQTHWENISSLPAFRSFQALTEDGSRVWGTEDDIQYVLDEFTGSSEVM